MLLVFNARKRMRSLRAAQIGKRLAINTFG